MNAITSHKTHEPLSKQRYREAMSSLAAAVNIVTTDGPMGRAGFTATAVCSVSDEPPTLLVCLNRNTSVYNAFNAHDNLCVNTLSPELRSLSDLFGGKCSMNDRFNATNWSTSVTGAPVLKDALISFDCIIVEQVQAGSHDVLLCQVQEINHNYGDQCLIYYQRNYHYLGQPLPQHPS